MIWQDLLLDRWVGEEALQAAAAAAFGIPLSAIAIIDEAAQREIATPQASVLLERTRQHRDFPLQLMVVLRDDALAQRLAGFDGALQVARVIAARLGCAVVFAEGPLTPSIWLRVRPSGHLDAVSLDTDDNDDVASFFVVAEYPFPAVHAEGEASGSRLSA
jgi:hypothetical protein